MSDDLTTTTAGPTTTSEPTTRVKELREGQNEGSVNTAEGDGSDAERSSKITTNAGPGTSTAGTTLTAVDREKASLSTTTPSTTLNTKEGEADESSPDKSTAEVPEKAKTATPPPLKSEKTKTRENGAKNDKPSSKQKPSFWSNFFRTMFCLGSPDTHDLDLPMVESKPREKTKEPSTASTTEAAGKHVPPAIDTKTASMPVPLDLPLAVPSTPSRDRSATADPAVIVPPTPPSQTLPPSETGGVTSGSVQYPGSTGDESLLAHREQLTHSHSGTVDGEDDEHDEADESFTDDEAAEGDTTQDTTQGLTSPNPHGRNMYPVMTSDEEEEERLILQGGAGIPIGPDGEPRPLLPPVFAQHNGRKCLVLDLDETLVHSSFKLIPQADYVVPVEIEHQFHNVYVIKRPGVDAFLQKMGELYEIVVFTASLSKYADPVLDKLDQTRVVTHRLFRESCYQHRGNYIKDLSQLGRPLASTIILDNSPASYIFHPNNAVPVSSWFNDPHDTELVDLCPFLGDLRVVDDVRGVLDGAL